ncbi:MAG: DUF3857 domain-containing protein [Lutibacter sp.]
MHKKVLLLLLFLTSQIIISQNYKVGKISKDELAEKVYPLDSSANAAILYKNRKTYFKYDQEKGFLIITKVQERIKIYNKDGYDWATKSISYYKPSLDAERVVVSNAKTYQLKNGKIEKFKLNKSDVFDVQQNKYWATKKFTMPNITDGCVVEWTYTITSPYRSINDVELQAEIPIKKIECKVEIPEYYVYNINQTGYLTIPLIKETKNSSIEIHSKSRTTGKVASTSFSNDKVEYKSAVSKIENSNVPALLNEPFVNNIENYKSGLHYELSMVKWPNQPPKYYAKSWDDVAKTIAKNSHFGGELNKTGYFQEDLALLKTKFTNKNSLMVAIFEFVKHKVKWNKSYGKYSYNGVRTAYKKGEGNVADINLILVAMLRAAGINANPVILSSRSHGVPIFPTLEGFNYVIAGVELDKGYLLFDATSENSTPNVLPLRDLNWKGRIIRPDRSSSWINLKSQPADLFVVAQAFIDEDGAVNGFERRTYKNYNAYRFRNKYGKIKNEDISSKIEEKYNNIEISEYDVSNKKNNYKPVITKFKFDSDELINVVGNKMYFNPLLYLSETKNPFKLEKREYPIDFGTPTVEKQIISIKIPEGYKVESLPENYAVQLPNKYGLFKFSATVSNNAINIISLIQINTPIILNLYYSQVKEFFKQIIAKNKEQIVLTKA